MSPLQHRKEAPFLFCTFDKDEGSQGVAQGQFSTGFLQPFVGISSAI